MSFAIWNEKPSFTFEPEDREQIYQVGEKWVVTDDATRATQENVDALKQQVTPEPTKAQLLGQINLLIAKVEALP